MASMSALASASWARDRAAREDHRQRLLDAGEARQALRAAGARQEAELDLGQAEPRGGSGDAIVAAERRLEAAAERRAVQRRDDRLRGVLHRRDDVVQVGGCGGLPNSRDVGAGDEGAARADQHDRVDVGIVAAALDAFLDAVAHAMAQRIHRRIVDGDDGDVAVATQTDWIVQGRSLALFNSYSRLRTVRAGARVEFRTAKRTFCTLTATLGCGGLACQMPARCDTRACVQRWERGRA